VKVAGGVVADTNNSFSGSDVLVSAFGRNPTVNPLTGSSLEMVLPREISKADSSSPSADGPTVEEIAFSGPESFLRGRESEPERRALPLMVAVEKGGVKGVVSARGSTRMLVIGDSIFLDNQLIDAAANRDFAGYAVNWLLDRTLLLEGLGPKPITEYRITVGQGQLQKLEWILLGAMPGGVLMVGGLVWLRRRR
jgi:hypothetical protein